MNGQDIEKTRSNAIPLTVITGFQGSGKTTLIHTVLEAHHGLHIIAIVSDLKSVSIAKDLVFCADSSCITLKNGCAWFQMSGDMMEAIKKALSKFKNPDHILIEAPGVADPGGITVSFTEKLVREHIRLDGIVSILDAVTFLETPEEIHLKLWQLAFSDLLVLNKVDLVSEQRVLKIKDWLDENLIRYRLAESRFCNIPVEILLGIQAINEMKDEATPNKNGFETWVYETEKILSIEIVRRIAARLPTEIYRCKGIIYAIESPDHMYELHVVGKRVDLVQGEEWGNLKKKTKIKAIGTTFLLNRLLLEIEFDKCIVKDPLNFRKS